MNSSTSRVTLPLEMYTPFIPNLAASLNTATAHSDVINGSLYDDPTNFAPCLRPSSAICAAEILSGYAPDIADARSRRACEVTQFWQYGQCRSHPSIPNVSVSELG